MDEKGTSEKKPQCDASLLRRVTQQRGRCPCGPGCDAEYGPGGHFIPCITYGGIGTIYPHVDGIVKDEIAKCSAKYF